ncbi:hypothetical protein HCDSEM_054 [Candidatus Hodgkinia cicadicola Dsem]|nr:hypothetical protein HCDSEM_054 [Candidatus Hodgkinia cicadicola Dsem]
MRSLEEKMRRTRSRSAGACGLSCANVPNLLGEGVGLRCGAFFLTAWARRLQI